MGDGSSSAMEGVEAFVWRESDGSSSGSKSSSHKPCWTIRYRKKSGIYDNDPHSLKVPRSHNAWKNELMMTRFANQELPEAMWGDNFLELSYGSTNKATEKNPSDSIRISFCALEGLRTWALMDMGVEQKEDNKQDEKSDNNGNYVTKKESKKPTIIPHKSGRAPDAWDYTYTTNYSGSVECMSHADSKFGHGFYDAKQPDRTTLYSIKVSMSQESPKSPKTSSSTQGKAFSNPIGRFSTTPTAVLRPPMCKCVGGRMICAGVAQTLASGKSQATANRQLNKQPLFKSEAATSSQVPRSTPKPSPNWIPYCSDTDGPFDMEALLNSQISPPLHYTGTIPFWIQNLDPHSYSFLTATAVVCNGDNGVAKSGGFIAVLLRCFVRVNGVRVRLIDTKFVVRRQRPSERNQDHKSKGTPPMVVLRERSWKEGSWEEYTAGMKGSRAGNYHFLGTDLEQGSRASKNLLNIFPPIVEKLVLYDDDKFGVTHGNKKKNHDVLNQHYEPKGSIHSAHTEVSVPAHEERRIPLLEGKSVSMCAIGADVLVSVVDECTIVAMNVLSGKILWEHNMAPSSVLSLAVHSERHPSLSQKGKIKVVVGDDRGCVHVIERNEVDETTKDADRNITRQFYFFQGGNKENRHSISSVQKPFMWVEKVAWSPCGNHFAATAGKNVMINSRIIKMEGTIYDISFLPYRKSIDPDTGKEGQLDSTPDEQLLAIAVYGGLTIVNAVTKAVRHRQFTVGSSAILSFGISPNSQAIGIGCHDKRLRVVENVEAAIVNRNDGTESNGINPFNAHDWIGMDGGITCVTFSPDNQRLAALGGSILFVIDRTSKWGEAPTVCAIHEKTEEKSRKHGKFKSIAWFTKDILAASNDRFLYMFDLRATVDTVPKRLFSFASTPLEDDFLVNGAVGEIIEWGKSGIRKINLSHGDFD